MRHIGDPLKLREGSPCPLRAHTKLVFIESVASLGRTTAVIGWNALMTEDLWTTIDLPVLKALAGHEATPLAIEQVRDLVGLSQEEIPAPFKGSLSQGYIHARATGSPVMSPPYFDEIRLGERGLREVKQWPAEPENAQDPEAENDRSFMELAIAEARKCKSEAERVSPKVGAVVVRDGRVVDVAFRGELAPGDHAEYTLLEKKLPEDVLAGSTLYTTLEPCTTRNEPKLPCAERIIDRRMRKVVIGVLDPNRAILGTGEQRLRQAGIEIGRFDPDLMAQIEELNRDFIRLHIASSESDQEHEQPSGPDPTSPSADVGRTPHVRNACLFVLNPGDVSIGSIELAGRSGWRTTRRNHSTSSDCDAVTSYREIWRRSSNEDSRSGPRGVPSPNDGVMRFY